jgi:hypothetical protein
MMMRVVMSIPDGNAMIKSGRMPQFWGDALARMKPEAAYFTADKGERTAYIVLDVKDSSEMPGLAEPFFLHLGANVDFQPVMNGEDLKKGLAAVVRD